MKHRSENGARFEGWPLECDASGTRPPSNLAGLRNQVRLVRREAEAGNLREVGLQLDALLDDLSAPGVRFEWRGAADRAKDADRQRAGIAAYCAENPAMVD